MIRDALSGHSDYFAPMWTDPAMQEKLEALIPGWKGSAGLERHLVLTFFPLIFASHACRPQSSCPLSMPYRGNARLKSALAANESFLEQLQKL